MEQDSVTLKLKPSGTGAQEKSITRATSTRGATSTRQGKIFSLFAIQVKHSMLILQQYLKILVDLSQESQQFVQHLFYTV